jgi:hypothetical protein
MRRIVLLGLLAVGGCTPMQWTRQDANAEQLSRDLKECQAEAFWEAQSRPFGFPHIGPALVQDSTGRRFFVYPYGPFADPYGDRFMEEGRLAHWCMRSRGYQLAPAPSSQIPYAGSGVAASGQSGSLPVLSLQ